MNVKDKIRRLLIEGVYNQHEIFARLYPSYVGHYSKLRQEIAEVKEYA